MNRKIYIAVLFVALLGFACKPVGEKLPIALDKEAIEVEAVGGVEKIEIKSTDKWIASTDNPWITISPANGVGDVVCEVKIDSALYAEPRTGVVRIENLATWETKEVKINQKGFPYSITIDKAEVSLSNYDEYDNRYFDLLVTSNVDFRVDIPGAAESWLSTEKYTLNLDRGVRPRQVKVRFKWDINSSPSERLAEVQFTPRKSITLDHADRLNVKQEAAEPIIPNTRAGDSVALLCIGRALRMLTPFDPSQPMEMWNGVTLWTAGDKGCTPENVGRVRRAEFTLFNTTEKLPFEVKYLTAAEELYFFGNTNTFMRSLELGDDIAELTQLRSLTVGGYGLVDVPESLANLKNLEHLDLGANNFQTVPDVLTKENFPNLRALILNANQRSTVYDLSNTVKTEIGGFIDEPEFPVDLIKWGLDTLVLSVNYLQGEIPDLLDDDDFPYYTEQDLIEADTLPRFLVDNKIKKVMPTTKRFSINLNRLSGKLPDWLLYHPALDWWIPYSLVFPQEGRAQDGTAAMFDNEPINLNYYYEVYPDKKMADSYAPEQEPTE